MSKKLLKKCSDTSELDKSEKMKIRLVSAGDEPDINLLYR